MIHNASTRGDSEGKAKTGMLAALTRCSQSARGSGLDLCVQYACRAQAIAVLLKDSARLEQERAAFANKRQVYKGFSREQLSNGGLQRTHSADSMEGPYSSGNASYSRPQVTQFHYLIGGSNTVSC